MLVGWSSDPDFAEVSDGVHGLRESSVCGAFRPQKCLGIRLWKYTWRTDEVPSRQRKACIAMILLSGDILQAGDVLSAGVCSADITHVVVYGQRWVLWTPHLPVLVTLTKAVSTWRITQLRSLSKELSGIFIVNKYDVMDSPFVQECELVQGMRELGSSMLGGAFEPLDAFLRSLRQAQFAVKFGNSEPVQRTWVGRSPSLAVKLYCLCGLPTTAPPILAACSGTVGSIRVAVFGGENKKGKGAVKVLAILVCTDAIRVAIGQKILRGHVSTVCVPLEEGSGLFNEIFALIYRLFHVHHVGRREFGNGERLGSVDHEDGKFELQIRILRLFGVGAVQLQGSFMGEECCLFSGT